MAEIFVEVQNVTSDNVIVHVVDRFAGGSREVGGSPFALASNEVSAPFMVNAGGGEGRIDWSLEGGTNSSDIRVQDAQIVPIS